MSKFKTLVGILFVLAIPGCMDPPPGHSVPPKPNVCISMWIPPIKPSTPTVDTEQYEQLTQKARHAKSPRERQLADISARNLLVKNIEELNKVSTDYDKALRESRIRYAEQCYPNYQN